MLPFTFKTFSGILSSSLEFMFWKVLFFLYFHFCSRRKKWGPVIRATLFYMHYYLKNFFNKKKEKKRKKKNYRILMFNFFKESLFVIVVFEN